MIPQIEYVDTCASTSAVLAARADAPGGTVICAHTQTAGRGQRGNSWEAEPGKNLTFSMLIRPEGIEAARQFELSMLVSLAICDVVDSVIGSGRSRIKWPNDIYVEDKKICGILIENSLAGRRIDRSIAGIGLNVNQETFLSDAPNPASLCHFGAPCPMDLKALLERLTGEIAARIDAYTAAPAPDALMSDYMRRLWRGRGTWPFRRDDGTLIEASIVSVAPDGHLTLSDSRTYAFKEIAFVL